MDQNIQDLQVIQKEKAVRENRVKSFKIVNQPTHTEQTKAPNKITK